jgi:hypothetical protein
MFSATVGLNNIGALHTTCYITLEVPFNGKAYFTYDGNPANAKDAFGYMGQSGCLWIMLTAGNSVSVVVNVAGSTKTVSITGSNAETRVATFFQGVFLG